MLPYEILLNIFFSCKNLANKDILSKSDPMIELYMNDTFIGRTEKVKNNLNPSFSTPIKVTYNFEKLQNLTIKIIDVDNENNSTNDNLGNVKTTLGELVSQEPGTAFTLPVNNGKGTVTMTFEEIIPSIRKTLTSDYVALDNGLVTQEVKEGSSYKTVVDKFIINAKGIDLEKKDMIGKSDPYYYIYRLIGGNKILIYKSEIIKSNLNPIWKTTEIYTENLDTNCFGRGQRYWIEVYDYDKYGSDDLIGEVELEDLFYEISPDGQEFRGELTDKSRKNKYKKRGEIVLNITHTVSIKEETVNSYKVISNYTFAKNLKAYPNLQSTVSFIDAMKMGMKLNVICAVDYTSSNGSMHDVVAHTMNPYQTALSAVGQVLEPYDHDKKFSFLGYGGHKNGEFPPYFTVGETEQVDGGVQGILDTYARTRDMIKMGDMGTAKGGDMDWRANNGKYYCDDFYQIINAISDKAENDMMTKFPPGSHQLPSDYYIIFFVIDGDGFDMDGTIRALVRASSLPVSIVLIGVGDGSFANLSKFDADGMPLTVDEVSTIRDIVQFVKFNECKTDGTVDIIKLAAEVLAEIPTQVETFIGLYGCNIVNNVWTGYQN